ncbi:MAG: 30S ribosomal protein S21 [Chloroflexia bacterium]|nr:30S ribosomal protein S21 [Chloroflexia bacterium]
MPSMERKSEHSLEGLLKQFRRELVQSGQLRDYRRKQSYISKSERKREKMRKAIRRIRRKERRQQDPSSSRY